MPLSKACLANEVTTLKAFKVCLDGQDILLAKSEDGRIWAFDAMCSHAEKSLEKGRWDAQKAEIMCPFHKAVFAVSEGGAVKAPPAFVGISTYDVQIITENGDEFVFVDVE